MTTTRPDAAPAQLSHREILEVLAGLLSALFVARLSTTLGSTPRPTNNTNGTSSSDPRGQRAQRTGVPDAAGRQAGSGGRGVSCGCRCRSATSTTPTG